MNDLPASLRAFRDRGRMLRLSGVEVFTFDSDPGGGERATLLLHGFPTSSHDFHRVLPDLARVGRTVMLDLPGYGLSEKPVRYGYSLFEQADVVELFLREIGVRAARIVAHDMGTSVACELFARRERGLLTFDAQKLVLMNGSVHIALAHLTPSQLVLLSRFGGLFAKLASRRAFELQMRRILARPVGDEEIEAMWAGLVHRGGRDVMPKLIGYVRERYRFYDRWVGALSRLDVPALVLWGVLDPVAVVAIAERLAAEIPGARYERLEGVGHYPQLEAPAETGASLVRFLSAESRWGRERPQTPGAC